MSSRRKKQLNKLARKAIDGRISEAEFRRRVAAERVRQASKTARAAVAKASAAPGHWTAAQRALWDQAQASRDPLVRERAAQALADQALADKGLIPGTSAPEVTKSARGLVWAPGPDGTWGWWPARDPGPRDLGFMPPGVAGR